MRAADDGGPITAINVTPMVDILLVVLIIFMATASLIHRRAIKVDVPKSERAARAAPNSFLVSCDVRRRIFAGGKAMTPAHLTELLRVYASADPDFRVTLAADKGLTYGDVVSVLDSIRASGVVRVALEVSPK